LAAKGFAVTSVDSAEAALAAAVEARFAQAVVEMRLGKGNGFGLIRRLRELHAPTRIARHGSSSSPITTASPARSSRCAPAPTTTSRSRPIPATPLRVERVRWEHIKRVFEQCGRNRTETARRLGMHRRSLQRMLTKRKRVPCPRDSPTPWAGRAEVPRGQPGARVVFSNRSIASISEGPTLASAAPPFSKYRGVV
jgi:two-component system response regulator RegA